MAENGNRERTRALAISKTMADNHLSSIAMQGRGGDTELAHVNPREKSMLKSMGGSGTINPNTGLREYQDPFAIFSAGMGAYQSYQSGKAGEAQAGFEIEAAEEGLKALEGAEDQAQQSKSAQEQSIMQDYSMATEKLSAETGIRKEDLEKQTATAIQRSGLATSGSIEQKKSTSWGRIEGAFGRGKEGLMSSLGKKMGELEGWFEGEVARIGSERSKFQRAKEMSEAKAEAGYLGKGLGKGRSKNIFKPSKWRL